MRDGWLFPHSALVNGCGVSVNLHHGAELFYTPRGPHNQQSRSQHPKTLNVTDVFIPGLQSIDEARLLQFFNISRAKI